MGRLFNKLKELIIKAKKKLIIIDWIFIFFGLLLLVGFYFFFKRETRYIKIKVKVTDEHILYAGTNPINQYAHSFKVGDQTKDELGRPVAQITSVERIRNVKDRQIVYVTLEVKSVYNPRTEKYSLQGKDIIFGEMVEFNLSNVKFSGLIVDFPGYSEWIKAKKEEVVVESKIRYESREYSDIYGIPIYLANQIDEGVVSKSSQGEPLAEVLEVSFAPAKRTVVSNTGIVKTVNDPELVDVSLKVKLYTKIIGGERYMFDYLPVLVDQSFPLYINDALVSPVITKIYTD